MEKINNLVAIDLEHFPKYNTRRNRTPRQKCSKSACVPYRHMFYIEAYPLLGPPNLKKSLTDQILIFGRSRAHGQTYAYFPPWVRCYEFLSRVNGELLESFVSFLQGIMRLHCGHIFGMLESAYKNKRFVNFIFETISRNAVLLMKC